MTENGIIRIIKTHKGFSCNVEINGKLVTCSSYKPNNFEMDGKNCVVERMKGQIMSLSVDGNTIFHKNNDVPNKKNTETAKNNDNSYKDIFDITNTKLPKDTRNFLKENNVAIDNFYLKYNKASVYDFKKKKFIFYDSKHDKLNLTTFNKLNISDIANRKKECIKRLKMDIKSLNFKPEWRMVIGLGNESVYEVSICLHHLYGVPYIPGQAIKGVVRSYVIDKLFGGEEDKEQCALKIDSFRRIFGSQKNKGQVVFFDAYPVSVPNIDIDIMNPHFSQYYSSGGLKPPADYYCPIPINFLTVSNTEFQFILGVNKENNMNLNNNNLEFNGNNILDIAENMLVEALEFHGIGAKTSCGYGYMQKV